MPSMELFNKQSLNYQKKILGSKPKVIIEAASSFGWHKYVGKDALFITVEDFGHSAPAGNIAKHLGFTKESIVKKTEAHIKTYKLYYFIINLTILHNIDLSLKA